MFVSFNEEGVVVSFYQFLDTEDMTGIYEISEEQAKNLNDLRLIDGVVTLSLEARRAAMVLSPAQARLKLASIDMLTTVNTAINALPETDAMRIKWEYATQIERLDPDLIAFCTTTLAMTDEQIDGLFA